MNEVTTQQPMAVTTGESWGAEGASNNDILVPRLMLMHDISDLVKERKADPGDIVGSVDGKVLAKFRQTLEVIPITTYREWLVNEVDGKKEKFLARFPITDQNESLEREGVENGKAVRRYRTLNFFVLLPGKLDELPFLLTFKKSNLMTGKQLSTHFQMSAMKRKPPASTVFDLGAKDKSYDGNTFKVFTLAMGRQTSPEELSVAKNWYEVLNKQNVKVQEEYDETFDATAFGT
jgi:hypothetical protein